MIDHAKLCRVHESLFEEAPNETHLTLYRAFPKSHGYKGHDQDLSRLQASLVLGIAQTYPSGGDSFQRVLFVYPSFMDEWVTDQIANTVKGIVVNLVQQDRIPAAKVVKNALDKLLLGSRVLQIEEPPRWVAFGFDQDDLVPEWLKQGLL